MNDELIKDMAEWQRGILAGKDAVNRAVQERGNSTGLVTPRASIESTMMVTPATPFRAEPISRPATKGAAATTTHPFKVTVSGTTAIVEVDSRLYEKEDYLSEIEITNLLTAGDPTEFSVSAGDYLFLQGAYVDGELDEVTIEVGDTPGAEVETEDTMDDPPETQQTFWRYLICKIVDVSGTLTVNPQIARCNLRLLDKYFNGALVDYPLSL